MVVVVVVVVAEVVRVIVSGGGDPSKSKSPVQLLFSFAVGLSGVGLNAKSGEVSLPPTHVAFVDQSSLRLSATSNIPCYLLEEKSLVFCATRCPESKPHKGGCV